MISFWSGSRSRFQISFHTWTSVKKEKKTGAFIFFPSALNWRRCVGGWGGGEAEVWIPPSSCCFYVIHVADLDPNLQPELQERNLPPAREKVPEDRKLGEKVGRKYLSSRCWLAGQWGEGSQTHPLGLRDLPRLMKSVLTRTSSLSLHLHSLSSHL